MSRGADSAGSVEPGSACSSSAANVFIVLTLDVIERRRRGQPNKLIAYALNMNANTIKAHMRSITRKLRGTKQTQVALDVRSIHSPEPPQFPSSTVACKPSPSSTGREEQRPVVKTLTVSRVWIVR